MSLVMCFGAVFTAAKNTAEVGVAISAARWSAAFEVTAKYQALAAVGY